MLDKLRDVNNKYRFYCIPYGTADILEMEVKYTFIEDVTGKKYLIFKETNNSQKLYIREYYGKIEDEQYIRIRNRETVDRIIRFLKQNGMENINF